MFHWWCSNGLYGAVWGGLGWHGRGIRWYETEVFQAIEGEVEQLVVRYCSSCKMRKALGSRIGVT